MSSFSAAGVLFTLAMPLCAFAQVAPAAQSQGAAANPSFDVAAIHQHIPQPHEHNSIWSTPFDSHFKAENMDLVSLIHWAFQTPTSGILNVPGWAKSTMFNIDARSDSSVDEQMHGLTAAAGRDQKRNMVQALLADRFKLVVHTETRELPIYVMVAAKNGPTLGPAKEDGTTINHGRDHIEVQGGNSTGLLAEELSHEVGRQVIDKTGIEGRYDLKLNWTPDDRASDAAVDTGPSIFTALQEELGLKLEPQKAPVEVLVVDHVEMPTEN